jgi:hypothetical protein
VSFHNKLIQLAHEICWTPRGIIRKPKIFFIEKMYRGGQYRRKVLSQKGKYYIWQYSAILDAVAIFSVSAVSIQLEYFLIAK